MDLGDEFVKVGLTRGVHTGGGFIEQQQFRLVEEAGANQDALELPAAEPSHGAVEQSGDIHLGHRRVQLLIDLSGRTPEPGGGDRSSDGQEFPHRQHEARVELEALGYVANSSKERRIRWSLLQETDGARVGFLQTQQTSEQGGLAGAVGSDQRHHAPGFDAQVDAT